MRISLYLETSVIGAYLDNGDPFRRDLTMRWWERESHEYDVYSSRLVERELERVSEPHRGSYLNLHRKLRQLSLEDEVAILAEGYIDRGIFHRQYIGDAMHVALAAFNSIDYLVTWNFGHIANIRKQARLRHFNASAGFHTPTIITPELLVHAV
jgi:predicted nucleic acid-binding protein